VWVIGHDDDWTRAWDQAEVVFVAVALYIQSRQHSLG
jgi:hypothetical protein